MLAQLKSGLGRMRPALAGLPGLPASFLKNLLPLVLLAIGLTVLVMLYLWRDSASYKPVFGSQEKVVAADMMAVLDADHIPYRIHPDSGQVLVPSEQLGRVRMLLASKGVVAKLPAGLELMDQSDPLGVSQFVQDIRFRRGLEGELVQSIGALDAVQAVRVHLSIAKSTSFVVSDGEKSSASVLLTLKPGRQLEREQIAAIIKLVAGSVASLDPERVSLVDQAGNLLSARVDLSDGFAGAEGNEAQQRYQQAALRNVRELLAGTVGEDNYKVSVAAEVDTDRVEETHEQYGETPKVTNEAMREEQSKDQIALGVPGSLSNRPVNANTSTPADAVARKNATTRQYAYDRNVMQIKRGRDRLRKLSVAVVLNKAAAPSPKAGWTAEELADLERILRNGLGIDEARGDSLVVSSLAFPARAAPLPWWQERDRQLDMASWLAVGLAAVLGFFLIVRPLLRSLQQWVAGRQRDTELRELALQAPAQLAAPEAAPAAGSRLAVVPLLENYDLPPAGSNVDVLVDHLKGLAQKEPERVAEVVKQWVQKHGRSS